MFRKVTLALILFVLGTAPSFAQCPMCKASVESSQSEAGIGRSSDSTGTGNVENGQSGTKKKVGMGLNVGILILLTSVYVILFSVGILWYKRYRRNQINEYAG